MVCLLTGFLSAMDESHSGIVKIVDKSDIGLTPALKSFCQKIETRFLKYGWGKSQCESFTWNHVRNSVLGDPLSWTVFGDTGHGALSDLKEKDLTIVMCGVHGDEITPIKFCYDLMFYLREQFSDKTQDEFKNKVVIVAPIVNPDSFFKLRPTRTNARGVDVNRNFPTIDWLKDARRLWALKHNKDKRRNPGVSPSSEPEVVFQINLIKRYAPDKIISVHAPLTFLDYDGPSSVLSSVDGTKAEELLVQMSKDSSDYKVVNYPFFPGSLGNWAGKEREIPTYTLELPSSDPRKSQVYWPQFKSAMHKAIVHDLKVSIAKKIEINQEAENDPTKKAQ